MTDTTEPTAAPELETPSGPGETPGAEAIARCACGVPWGLAHYCRVQDHNWIKATEPAEPS
jgi:hypothetical protein